MPAFSFVRMALLFSLALATLGASSAIAVPSPTPTSAPIIHPDLDRKFEAAGKPVEHTSVKDQGRVGFCWSYSTTARIEAEYLKKTGITLDLSEEFIGFYHIYDQILALAPTYFTTMERKPGKSGFGTDLLIYFFFHPGEGAPDLTLANALIEKYGIVPESAFSYKITGGFLQRGVEGRVRRFINQILRDPVKNREYRELNKDGSVSSRPVPAKILAELAKIYTLESEFDPAPKPGEVCRSCELMAAIQGFDFGGAHYTPKTFAKNLLGFSAANYEQIKVTPKNQAEAYARLQASLENGDAAEIGLTLFNGYHEAHLGNAVFSPETCGATTPCEVAGGHALLIVNRTIDPATRRTNGIVVKNSWGTKTGRDANGEFSASKGYDIITPDYLTEYYKMKLDPGQTPEWDLLVRKAGR